MAFVSGPRGVGKTTTGREVATTYLDWDNLENRKLILAGPEALARQLGVNQPVKEPLVVAVDQFQKYGRWKNLLKGFFDTYEDRVRLVVTGSSRLDYYRPGQDSLMGRYFRFRMHPFTVAEVLHPEPPGDEVIRPPRAIPEEEYQALWVHGGFPEPFVKRDPGFTRRWQRLRQEQILRKDVRVFTRIEERSKLEILAGLVALRSSTPIIYLDLAREAGVSVDTSRRWVGVLAELHYGFLVRPWFKEVSRALRKEPRWFLRDWSVVEEAEARAKTFVACHLLKAAQGWTDLGLGVFELRYVRDKEKREADFLVVKDGKPWFLVEVKTSESPLTPALAHFQKSTGAAHAFQVVMDLPYVAADGFARHEATLVSARTFLSQLL